MTSRFPSAAREHPRPVAAAASRPAGLPTGPSVARLLACPSEKAQAAPGRDNAVLVFFLVIEPACRAIGLLYIHIHFMGEPAPTPALETTQLLVRAGAGDPGAGDRLMPRVYDELRALAAIFLKAERPDHTLQATAVVHEAFIRLFNGSTMDYRSRAHFMGMAARAIRNILVDHARRRLAAKRGGGAARIPLTDSTVAFEHSPEGLVELDDALARLQRLNDRHARVVELRFFGGLTVEQTADLLGVSPATVRLDWRCARAWLREALQR